MISKEEFIQLYVEQELTLGEIARMKGVTLRCVCRWRKKFGIPIQQHSYDKRGGAPSGDDREYILTRVYRSACCPTRCWEWLGSKTTFGYGQCSRSRIERYSHRLTYRAFRGPIPEGMYVCHTCDNPSCCNPDHLWLGTAKDNAQDRETKGRGNQAKGEKASRAKLTEKQVREIRRRYTMGEGTWTLCKDYPITLATVVDIVRNRIWKHID